MLTRSPAGPIVEALVRSTPVSFRPSAPRRARVPLSSRGPNGDEPAPKSDPGRMSHCTRPRRSTVARAALRTRRSRMHRTRHTTIVAALLVLLSAGVSQSQVTRTDSRAHPARPSAAELTAQFAPVPAALINAAKLGPGKNVMILGGRDMLPLMEQTAIEVERHGANATLIMTTDSLEQARLALPSAQRI